MYRPAYHVVHANTIGLNEIDSLSGSYDKRLANNAALDEFITEYVGRYRSQVFQFEMAHAEHPLTHSG